MTQEITEVKLEIQKYKHNEECLLHWISMFSYSDGIQKVKLLNPFEKVVLCMMWLRICILVIDLADKFHIFKKTTANAFSDVLNLLF